MGILVNDGDSKPVNLAAYAVTFTKVESVKKHGSHDQKTHGAWANGKYNPDDSEGEDEIEPKNYRTPEKLSDLKDDSEGEFEDLNYDDPRRMDDMDILRPFGGNAFANSWGRAKQSVASTKDPKAMMRDYDKMEAKWREKLNSKPYDPANPEYGDPQDLASTDFYRKYGVYPDEVPM